MNLNQLAITHIFVNNQTVKLSHATPEQIQDWLDSSPTPELRNQRKTVLYATNYCAGPQTLLKILENNDHNYPERAP